VRQHPISTCVASCLLVPPRVVAEASLEEALVALPEVVACLCLEVVGAVPPPTFQRALVVAVGQPSELYLSWASRYRQPCSQASPAVHQPRPLRALSPRVWNSKPLEILAALEAQPWAEIFFERRFFCLNATVGDPSWRQSLVSLEIYDRLCHDHVHPCRGLFL
jgi:hypothetical protein